MTRSDPWPPLKLAAYVLAVLIMVCGLWIDGALAQTTTTTTATEAEAAESSSAAAQEEQAAQQQASAAAAEEPQYSDIWVIRTLQKNAMVEIFPTLAIGYWVGAISFAGFKLGAVTGTLLAGVLIGQLDITISSQDKTIFFLFFLFAVGYGVGPQFVRGIASDAAPQAGMAVVICLLCLGIAYVAAIVGGFDIGYAAGLYGGATTISASIGLATDAINSSALPNAGEVVNNIPIAYAVTYLFGTVGTGMILAYLGPTLLGIDLAEECKRYEREHSAGGPEGGMESAWHRFDMRAFKVKPDSKAVGRTVAQTEALHPDVRIFFDGIRRDGEIIEFDKDTVLKAGDICAVSGPTDALVQAIAPVADEVVDIELIDVPIESVDVFVQKKEVDGRTLLELSKEDFTRGVYLTKVTRGATSVDIPLLADTKVERGDILKITGTKIHTDRVVKALGYADRPTTATDVVYVGLGITIGALVGSIVIPVQGVPITLSTSGGALIASIVFGWLRCVYPAFGRVPAPALWIMNSVGLNTFIAVVGISAGPGFVAGLQEAGISLFLWGVVVTSVPMLLAPWIGKYLFRLDPAINLGVCGGARTSTASVAMVGEKARSNVPMLGYTVPYAVSNTLLTIWGMVIVLLLL